MITILSVGKKHDTWIQPGLERYEKRLKQPWNIKWELIPHSAYEGIKAREEESMAILARLSPASYVILLDERGTCFSSPQITKKLEHCFSHSLPVTIVIGGAYGVTEQLHQRAALVWSLSALVFPHQLVRLLLAEQLYRAQSISTGTSYHHI